MPRLLFTLVIFFQLTGCVSAPTYTGTQTLIGVTDIQTSPTIPVNSISTPTPESIRIFESTPYIEYSTKDLWLRLFSPRDGDIVAQPVINVSGQVPAEIVISLNEDIFLIAEEGNFSFPVRLEEGPNVVEIVASNLVGDEIDIILTVVYEKE